MKLNLEHIRALIQLLEESNLTEIEVQQDDDRIRVRKDLAPLLASAPASVVPPNRSEPEASTAEAQEAEGLYVTSPFVGTFYRAPTPDAEPFVEVGDEIHQGQVLCIVEAMKLMNEIEAEVQGRVIEVLVENGRPVEFGDRLFRLETA